MITITENEIEFNYYNPGTHTCMHTHTSSIGGKVCDPVMLLCYCVFTPSRFCAMDYHPFDANELNKYVVVDDYTQTWEVRTGRPASTIIVLVC